MSRRQTLEDIRALGAALAATWPPLTDEQVARIRVHLAPAFPTAPARVDAPAPQLKRAA